MASNAHGFNLRGGVGIESVYGTEVAITRKLPLLQPFNFYSGAQVPIQTNALVGGATRGQSYSGLQSPQPPLSFEWDIGLRHPVFEQFFGTYTDGRSTGTLTLPDQVTAADTMTIGSITYTFDANGALSDTANHIELGTTLAGTQTNIFNAVNRAGTPGTGYAAATVVNPDAEITTFSTDVATLYAKVGGSGGDTVATTETFTSVNNVFSGATLSGGDTCLYTLDNAIDAEGLTLAADLTETDLDRTAYAGMKTSQMVISGASGGILQVVCTTMASSIVLNSSTNTIAVVTALAEPPARYLYHHGAGAMLVGDQANALVSGDNLKITGFSLTINRNLVQYHTQTVTPEEPVENDYQEVLLALNHPVVKDTEAFRAWQAAHTPLQAQFTFTRGSNTKIIRISNILTDPFDINVGGAGLVNYDTVLRCHDNAAGDNPNMTFTGALEIEET